MEIKKLSLIKQILFGILLGISVSLVLFMPFIINYFVFNYSSEINNYNYGVILEDHIKNKNLSLLFPNSEEFGTRYQIEINKKVLDYDLYEFQNLVIENYKYSVNEYDCKYWSYVWLVYALHNKDKYNWKVEIKEVTKHIFIIVSNSSQYCILDQIYVNCH